LARFYRRTSFRTRSPRMRRRGLRSGDSPPVRWEQMQWAYNTGLQGSVDGHTYDENHLFFAVPIIDMFMFTVGSGTSAGESDLSTAMSHIEIGGLVWSSHCHKVAPSTEVQAAVESVAELVYLQRTYLDGTPVSFPSPWQSVPPFGNDFAAEQEHVPIRWVSRRERFTTGFAQDYPFVVADFPTKSLRIRRRLGQNTSLVIQHSFTGASADGKTQVDEYDIRANGVLYYRVKF